MQDYRWDDRYREWHINEAPYLEDSQEMDLHTYEHQQWMASTQAAIDNLQSTDDAVDALNAALKRLVQLKGEDAQEHFEEEPKATTTNKITKRCIYRLISIDNRRQE